LIFSKPVIAHAIAYRDKAPASWRAFGVRARKFLQRSLLGYELDPPQDK